MSDVNVKGTRLSERLVTVGDSNRMPYEETPPSNPTPEIKDTHDKAANPGNDAKAKTLGAGLEAPRKRSLLSRILPFKP